MCASGIFFEIFKWFVDVIRHEDEIPCAPEPPLLPGRFDDGHKPYDRLSPCVMTTSSPLIVRSINSGKSCFAWFTSMVCMALILKLKCLKK
jgi:hypothetical protein